MDKDLLYIAIVSSWDGETTSSKESWTPQNRALGQCAVTACVVNDYLGGEILNSTATLPDGTPDSHYFNVIDGKVVDITRSQFPAGTTFTQGAPKTKEYATTREYVMSYEPTCERYELLKSRVAARLKYLQS